MVPPQSTQNTRSGRRVAVLEPIQSAVAMSVVTIAHIDPRSLQSDAISSSQGRS